MASPDALHEYPLITGLIGRLKRLSARLRDEYCPNTCTLHALKQQGLARRRDHSHSRCRASA